MPARTITTGRLRPRQGETLAAGGPLYRRRRARRDAPVYARFFIKAIRDMGMVDFGEPFMKLFNQGIIISDHQKMSKSRGNVVNPDEYVAELGADTVRAYMMFIGPWEQGGEWDDSGISGISRWLNRVWNLAGGRISSRRVRPRR